MKTKILCAAVAVLIAAACATFAANEITAAATFKISKGYLDSQRAVNSQYTITNAAPNVAGQSQTLYTNGWAEITIGDVSRKGWGWFRNLGSNGNEVVIGPGTSTNNATEFIRLKDGEFFFGPLGTNRIYGSVTGTNGQTTIIEKIIADR